MFTFVFAMAGIMLASKMIKLVLDRDPNQSFLLFQLIILSIGISYTFTNLILYQLGLVNISKQSERLFDILLIISILIWNIEMLFIFKESSNNFPKVDRYLNLQRLYLLLGVIVNSLVFVRLLPLWQIFVSNLLFGTLFASLIIYVGNLPVLNFLKLKYMSISILTKDGVEFYHANYSDSKLPVNTSLLSNWFAAISGHFSEFIGSDIQPETFELDEINIICYWGNKWVYLVAVNHYFSLLKQSLSSFANFVNQLEIPVDDYGIMLSEAEHYRITREFQKKFYYVSV